MTCVRCGCTEEDCSGCIARTGEPCSWFEPNRCTACVGRIYYYGRGECLRIVTLTGPDLRKTYRVDQAADIGEEFQRVELYDYKHNALVRVRKMIKENPEL